MNPNPSSSSPAVPLPDAPPLPKSALPMGNPQRFDYVAQAPDGMRMEGVIEAMNLDNAMARLSVMGLHVHQIRPAQPAKSIGSAPESTSRTARSLTPSDFAAFNEQLAQLATAGLPLEHGLRLIAADMRRGRLAAAIREVAAELERGVPLGEAFDKHRGRFPSLYGRVIEAGVKSGDLAGVLIGVGQHQELLQRLRGAMWRTLAYPLMVFVALALVLLFLGNFVMPRFAEIFHDFRIDLPFPTRVVLGIGPVVPYIAIAVLVIVVGIPMLWALLRLRGRESAVVDWLIIPIPVIGSIFRLSMIARWCDVLRIGVSAGLDLPKSIELASDAVGSPSLRRDGEQMKEAIQSGRPLEALPRRMLPATIPAAIDLTAGRHSLPETLVSLSQSYQRQAEVRIAAVPTLITPVGVILIAFSVGFVVMALLLPLVRIIQALTGM